MSPDIRPLGPSVAGADLDAAVEVLALGGNGVDGSLGDDDDAGGDAVGAQVGADLLGAAAGEVEVGAAGDGGGEVGLGVAGDGDDLGAAGGLGCFGEGCADSGA